jgi:ribose transport system ATP-binding protein
LSLIPDMTVAENIWFRREPMSGLATVRQRALRQQTLDLFDRYGFPFARPDQEVRRLTLAERQVVEVAKALARDPLVLILDEATSALAPRETEWLLGLSGKLAASGKLVIYISHRLPEVRAVASRVTVFRNGMTVAVHDTADVSDDEIISEMLGRRLERLFPERKPTATDRLALRIRGLTAGHRLRNVNLDLREGEVLGVGGLQGHGQRELFQTLFGIGKAKGTVELWGKTVTVRGPQHALTGRDGIALVPEDRRGQGLLLSKSVRENLTLSIIPRFSRFGVLNPRREKALVEEMIGFLRIKAKTPDQLAGTLSGGNQQKVIFGKMLLTEARVLLLFDPTRGVDVGTKGEIFQLMRDLAARGYAILFYSSDLPELVHVADRVAVMRDGGVAAVLEGEAISEDGILKAAMFEARAAV